MIILNVLKDKKLFSKFRKCELGLRSVAFLGHIVSSEGVDVDSMKTKVVKSLPRHLCLTDNRCFLGLVGYYRRFVEEFSSITYPIMT